MGHASSRLLPAVERGLLGPLAPYGFVALGGGGVRGETVECSNGWTLLTVSADWLEGELGVTVRTRAGLLSSLDDLIDLGRISGLRLTRLGRGVSAATVEAQLRKVADALIEQAPNVLIPDDG